MIATYIQELLETNNRVIVPDFGAFLVRATSKNKDKKDLALKLEDIYFSPFLKFNDELLSKYIIEKENINKEEANNKIKDFINLVKKDLDVDTPFIIKDFGKFIIDKQGKVQFITIAKEGSKAKKTQQKTTKPTKPKTIKSEPTKTTITINEKKSAEKSDKHTIKNEKVTRPNEPIKKEEPVKKQTKPITKEEPVKKETKPITKAVPTSAKPSYSQKTKSSPVNKGLVLAIAIGLPVAVVFIWAMLNLQTVTDFFNKEKDVNNKGKIENTTIKKIKSKTPKIDTKKVDKLKGIKKTTAKKNTSKKVEKETKTAVKNAPIATSGKYYVIAGSFKNENFANSFAKKLEKQGYKAEKISRPNGMFAVSYASYTDKQKALAEINYLTKEKNIKAWLLYY